MKKFLAGFLLCLFLFGAGKLIANHSLVSHGRWTDYPERQIESLDEIAYQLSRVANALEQRGNK